MSDTTVARINRINPDSIQALWLTVVLVGFLAIASFMVSFSGLHEVAAWAGLPEWLRWAVPVFIDVAILAYTLAVLIHRHRGEPTWASWASLGGFTLFSMIANAAHAWAMPHPNLAQQVIGAAVAALAPVSVFAATEQLGRLVIRHPASTDLSGNRGSGVTPDDPGPGTGAIADEKLPVEASLTDEDDPVDGVGGTLASPMPEREPVTVEATAAASDKPVSEPVQAEEPLTSSEPGSDTNQDSGMVSEAEAEAEAAVDRDGTQPVDPGHSGDGLPVVAVPLAGTVAGPERPRLSVVGRSGTKPSLVDWIHAEVAAGRTPTGKGAAAFLGVSERTGRRNLTDLKTERPEVFEGETISRREGTTR